MDPRGKTALVTGGAVRLGRALAVGLARRGANVAITYHRSADAGAEVVGELRALGVRALAVRCDQRHEDQVQAALATTLREYGRLDILVNSAAVFHRTPFETLDAAAWDEHVDTNLRGPYLFALHAAEALREHGCGKIVNIADIAGFRAWVHHIPYSVSKAGLISLTQGLARALAPDVQVNAVAPGAVLWPEDYPEDLRQQLVDRIPLQRGGSPEDVVRTVLYLIEGSDFVTGAVVPVDGGRSLL